MRLEQLYYLAEVAKTGSINLTAERIYVSQPTITESIKKMEQELGVTLLERSYRGVSFTEAGEKVLKAAEQILEIYNTLDSELGLFRDNKPAQLSGNFSVYATPGISNTLLPVALNVFGKHYPNVRTVAKESDILGILEEVRDGHADLAVVSIIENLLVSNKFCKLISDDIYFEKLCYDQLSILLSRHSPLASRKSISMKEALKHPLAFYSSHVVDWWIDILDKYGSPNVYLESNSIELFMNAIKENRAIGFAGEHSSKHFLIDNQEIINMPIKEDLKWVFAWLRPKHSEFSEAAQEFINVLKSLC